MWRGIQHSGSESRGPSRTRRRVARRTRLFSQSLERLEDRTLMSVYVYGKSSVPAVEGAAFSGTIAEFYDTAASTNASDFQVTIDWHDTNPSTFKAVPKTNYPGWFDVTATQRLSGNPQSL